MNILITLSALGLLLAAAYSLPYLAVRGLRASAEAGDAGGVARRVNVPLLTENMKATLVKRIAAKRSDDGSVSPIGKSAAPIAEAWIQGLVSLTIAPIGISRLFVARHPNPTSSTGDAPATAEDVDVSMRYESASSFAVQVLNRRSNATVNMRFSREGLSWRLIDVTLP